MILFLFYKIEGISFASYFVENIEVTEKKSSKMRIYNMLSLFCVVYTSLLRSWSWFEVFFFFSLGIEILSEHLLSLRGLVLALFASYLPRMYCVILDEDLRC